MAGTKHFTRMNYHVNRGLREIVAPHQTMPNKEWERIKNIFGGRCAYCGEKASQKNRGIIADHVVPATEFGEFVAGNVIPACQSCNDSRGNKCWRKFIVSKEFPGKEERIEKIESYLAEYRYVPPSPETALSAQQLEKYEKLLKHWAEVNLLAQDLYREVNEYRG